LTTIPRHVDDITPQWLSSALNTEVDGVAVRDVIGGTATKVLLELSYHTATPLPDALCLKAGLGDHAAQLAPVGIYEAEARFYREDRARSGVRAPVAFWADWDSDRYGAILMESLARPTVRFLDARSPLTASEAASGLENLAVLHASRWNSPDLDSAEWLDCLGDPDSKAAHYFASIDVAAVDDFLRKPSRAEVVPGQLADARVTSDAFRVYVASSSAGPRTLVHGDAHVGNTYIEHDRVSMADWQNVRRESPVFDVAYFLGSSLTTDDRRIHERELIAGYREDLVHAGVQSPPSAEELWWLYRIHMMYGYVAWLTNLEAFQPEDLTVATLQRFATAVVDLDTIALLESTR
jgi:hypothetical protein